MALLRAMSTRPAELLGLPGGTLRPGAPADVIVIDLDTPWVLDPAELQSSCKNTPFDEAQLQGRVVRTIVAGRTVLHELRLDRIAHARRVSAAMPGCVRCISCPHAPQAC